MQWLINFISKFLRGDRAGDIRLLGNRIIDCLCMYKEGDAVKEFHAEIVNVVKSGLLLVNTRLNILPDTGLEIRFKLPSTQELVRLHCTIIRMYPEKPQKWHYTAVKFDSESEPGIQNLMDFFHAKT